MNFSRTRIAPTPSGFLHLGNVLSFSLTASMARDTGASILLRVDDLDRDRVEPAFVEDIFETLRFLELPWDEGPVDAGDFERSWSQVHRMEGYARAMEVLRGSGMVYACACSRAQLANAGGDGGYPGTCRDKGLSLDAPDMNWRLRTEGRTLPAEMRDFVVRKKNGFPAYQLASVMDDIQFGVDVIARGEDLLPSTLAQMYLADVLLVAGMADAAVFKKTAFFHHALLMAEDGEKLSKSAGSTSIHYLRRQGASPADVFTLIARSVGWEEPVADWYRLATLLFAQGYGLGQ
jgi:glutamyl-tRNA synthetase